MLYLKNIQETNYNFKFSYFEKEECPQYVSGDTKKFAPFFGSSSISTNIIFRGLTFIDSDSVKDEIEYINYLINFKYNLKKPIEVIIKRDKFEYIADIKDLEIYSYGNSKFEVLREINEDLTDLFEEIVNTDENFLGKYPKKWKKILLDYIEYND